MHNKWLAIPTADGPMEGYYAVRDGAGPYPGVVVLQESFGVTRYLRSVCDRLADVGFAALAPELFHRSGHHVEVPYEHAPRAQQLLATLTNGMVTEDVGAAVAAVRARSEVDAERVGVVGFSAGGFAALLAGLTTAVRAIVAFYPGLLVRARPTLQLTPLLDRLPKLRVPTLLHFGGIDAGIPPEDVEAIRQAMAHVRARHELVVWPGANHGFHSDDRTPVYDPHSAEQAWHKTLAWLGRMVTSAP
jgi:carboxymethylenebutenolidase